MDEEIQPRRTPASRAEGITANKPSASPLASESQNSFTLPDKRWLTSGQWGCIIAYAGLPVMVYLFLFFVNRDYVLLLTTHPMGQKMGIIALVFMTSGVALSAILFYLINRSLPPNQPATQGKRRLLSGAIVIIGFVLFLLPAVYTVACGPAAIRIFEALNEQPTP